jgi:NAD+ kinase
MKISLLSKKEYKELEIIRQNFDICKNGEICISLGGDGTFTRAANSYTCPILPIRTNEKESIGYYSDVSIDNIDKIIKKIKNKEYTIEKCSNKLEITYKNKRFYAINEARLNNSMEEISFRIYKILKNKKERVYPYIISGDGLIITNVVGSTAYNKSAGGPIILTPDVLCLTLINADGPYTSPIIVSNDTEFEIEIVKYTGFLRYDSSNINKLKPGDKFRVKLSKKSVKIVKIKGMQEDFADKLDRIIKSKMIR